MGVVIKGKFGARFENFKIFTIDATPISITGSITLPPFTSSASGAVPVSARSSSQLPMFTSAGSGRVTVKGTSNRTIAPFTSVSSGMVKTSYAFKAVDVLPTYSAGQSTTSAATAENGSYAGRVGLSGQQARIIGTKNGSLYSLDFVNGVQDSSALIKLPSLRVNGPNATAGDFSKQTVFSCDVSIARKADATLVIGYRYIGDLDDPMIPNGQPVGAIIVNLRRSTLYWTLRINQNSNIQEFDVAPVTLNKKTNITLRTSGQGITAIVDGVESPNLLWSYLNYTFTPLVQSWSYTSIDNTIATVTSMSVNQ